MSVNAMPKVSTEQDQHTYPVQTYLENSTTLMKPAPSLLFEASDRFFGVVYNDAMQDTSCSSSTSCIDVSTLEGTKMLKCKMFNFKKFKFQILNSSKCWSFKKLKVQKFQNWNFKKFNVYLRCSCRYTTV